MDEEKERIDIRTYVIIYRYAKEAACKFLSGMKKFPKQEVQPSLSDDDNLHRFLDVIKQEMANINEGSAATRNLFSRIIGILSRHTIGQSETLLNNLRIICEEVFKDVIAELMVEEGRRRTELAAVEVVNDGEATEVGNPRSTDQEYFII